MLFMIDGESLQDMNGQVVGYMQPSDFVKNTGVSLHSYQKEHFCCIMVISRRPSGKRKGQYSV